MQGDVLRPLCDGLIRCDGLTGCDGLIRCEG
jgi:hypothetical protein